jgi:ABC-type polysaccharide/polyol phosphate export permease
MTAAPVLLRPRAYRDSFAAAWRLALRHRELLWELQKRDLSDRFVGSVLGALWSIVHPLLLMAVYVAVFGFVFKVKLDQTGTGELDYPAYLIAGFLPWLAMMDVMSRSAGVIYANVNLVKQVAFPLELLPAKGLLGAFIPQAVGTACLLAYIAVQFGYVPPAIVLLPVALLFQGLAALGLGWLLALVGAYFRDTPNVLQIFFQLNFFLMPVVVGPNATVGNGVKIQNNVSVYEGVTLEDFVFCGPSMVFTNVFNPRSEIPRMNELRPTLVKKGATLGANSTILCGIMIGQYALIGAGSVVTKDVPDHALVVGNPGRQTGWMCVCGVKLVIKGKKATCPTCEKRYTVTAGGMKTI